MNDAFFYDDGTSVKCFLAFLHQPSFVDYQKSSSVCDKGQLYGFMPYLVWVNFESKAFGILIVTVEFYELSLSCNVNLKTF